VLAHEVGGHAVTDAIPGLAEELARVVPAVADLSSYGSDLWQNWVEEAAADVYGLLNIGPSFAIGLGAWLKATKKPPAIDTSVRFVAGRPDDSHPVDLLRLYLLKGATDALPNFGKSKEGWVKEIERAIKSAAPGVEDINLYYTDPLSPQPRPLKELGQDAEKIGAAIVTKQLCSLHRRAISDIETWGEEDEQRALDVKQAAIANQPLTGLADDAHLLAGATLALSEDASLYNTLNQRLREALHDSCLKDPKVGPPAD
jgi:hypothetical protein